MLYLYSYYMRVRSFLLGTDKGTSDVAFPIAFGAVMFIITLDCASKNIRLYSGGFELVEKGVGIFGETGPSEPEAPVRPRNGCVAISDSPVFRCDMTDGFIINAIFATKFVDFI